MEMVGYKLQKGGVSGHRVDKELFRETNSRSWKKRMIEEYKRKAAEELTKNIIISKSDYLNKASENGVPICVVNPFIENFAAVTAKN